MLGGRPKGSEPGDWRQKRGLKQHRAERSGVHDGRQRDLFVLAMTGGPSNQSVHGGCEGQSREGTDVAGD